MIISHKKYIQKYNGMARHLERSPRVLIIEDNERRDASRKKNMTTSNTRIFKDEIVAK